MFKITNLNKKYENLVIFNNLDINFQQSKITTIIGPSGCGKTTLLNLIARIDKKDSGNIAIPKNVLISYMMQDDLLLPWRTLKENITLGLEVLKQNNIINNKPLLDSYMHQFELYGFQDSYPDTLSGGMKQRASLIRSLVCKPDLFLLDEPFSNMDFDIKLKIQNKLLKFYYQTESTIILVTHDIEDAIALSDQVLILSERPSVLKCKIDIDLGFENKDPIKARKSHKLRDYFVEIWGQLKYL